MIDINELRRLGEGQQWIGRWYDAGCETLMAERNGEHEEVAHLTPIGLVPYLVAVQPATISELLDRLEAAEKERDTLRARIEAMESDLRLIAETDPVDAALDPQRAVRIAVHSLYLAPGAQPAPSVPDGWLRAIDEALVVDHIGVANPGDTYEQARTKLDSLIDFHIDVATDPAVNGGWKLVPIEPTEKMINEGACASTLPGPRYIDSACAKQCWASMLAAAPEARP